jgi:hypothetical protein
MIIGQPPSRSHFFENGFSDTVAALARSLIGSFCGVAAKQNVISN